jgi:hypothetical protein
MSPTASHTGRRADDRRGAPPRRGTEIKRPAQDYERELRRHELAIGRSLTSVLPSDRPARMRELVEARRVMSGAVRDLQRLTRDLQADLERYSAQRSHTQREVLAYEAVAGEIEEVLLRWDARCEQLSATIERGNRRQGRPAGTQRQGAPAGGQGRPAGTQRQGTRPGGQGQGTRPGAQGQGRPHGAQGQGRPHGAQGQGRPHGAQGRPNGAQGRPNGAQGRPNGAQGRPNGAQDRSAGGQERSGRRQGGGRRGGPAGRSGGTGGRSEQPRTG